MKKNRSSKSADKDSKGSNILEDVKSYIIGDNSKVMYLSSNGERIMKFPWLFAVLFLLVFDVPSWIIALLLIFLMVFDLDLNIETRSKKDAVKKVTVDENEYKKNKKEVNLKQGKITEKDGYYELRI